VTTARAEILSRIQAALADRPVPSRIPRDYHTILPSEVDVIELFAERAADYQATVRVTDREQLPDVIAVATDGARLVVPAGVPSDWLAGLDAVTDDPPLTTTELDRIGAVLTGAAVAIALTGTVILDGGPDQGRRVITLLPNRHICVVPADRIVGTVAEALRRLTPGRPQTWISGPSATSDIELNRVEGVHGPRDLRIIVVR